MYYDVLVSIPQTNFPYNYNRHPESSKRPKFTEVVEVMSVDHKQVLKWRDIDKAVHPQAASLGGPLEAGQDLYPELQQTFLRNTIKH